jgi:hypothetical protein
MEGHCYGWHLQILGVAAGPAIAGLLSHVDFEVRFLSHTPAMSPSFIVMLVFKEPLLWRSFLTIESKRIPSIFVHFVLCKHLLMAP